MTPTRVIIVVIAVLAWSFVAWLGTHRSETPDVFGVYSYPWLVVLMCSGLAAAAITACTFGRLFEMLHCARREIALLVASSVLALCAAEAFVRIVDPLGIGYYEAMKSYHQALVADPDLVFTHPAHWVTTLQGVTISTNEQGFRDDAIEAKRPGELRVLELGDSVALGWGVEQSRTSARVLESILTNRLARPVRVLNTAVAGYNTEQEFAVLRRYYDSLRPDVVILVIVSNDDEIATPLDQRPYARAEALTGRDPPEVLSLLLRKAWIYRMGYHLHKYGKYDDQPLPQAEGWARALSAYQGIGEFCEQHGLLLVSFYHRMYYSPKNEVLVQAYANVARQHGWAFIDTRSWFPPENDAKRLVNSIVDTHANAAGHRLIAEKQATVLLRLLSEHARSQVPSR